MCSVVGVIIGMTQVDKAFNRKTSGSICSELKGGGIGGGGEGWDVALCGGDDPAARKNISLPNGVHHRDIHSFEGYPSVGLGV